MISVSAPVVAEPPSAGAIQNHLHDVDVFYRRLGVLEPVSRKELAAPEALVDAPAPQGPPHSEPPPDSAAASGPTFWVSRIVISESQVLSETELKTLAEGLQQRTVGLNELRGLVERINALYRERNFVTARAVLPQQDVVGGVVKIQLIEARIDEVQLTDNRFTRDNYITRRVNITAGALADVNALEDALLAFNAVNDVKLRALLQPGSKPHTTRYVLQATEPKNHRLSVFTDNAGRDTIGEERVGLSYANSSLTGHRDRLSIGGSYADGADAGYLVYSMPLNRYGTQAVLGVDYSQIVIVSGELATFNVQGKSTVASALVSHPFRAAPQRSLSGLFGVNFKDSETDFDGVDRFESSVRTLNIGVDYQKLGDGYMFYARPRLNVGVDSFGGDSSFTTLSGDAGAIINAAPSHQFAFRLSAQVADTTLLPSVEQFQLGGAASVRGYPEGLLIGDQGYFVSAEYRYAGFSSGGGGHTLQPFLFADHGGVFASGPGRALDRKDFLTSLGVGVSYRFSERLTANVQVGFPLSNHPDFTDDYAVHFHVNFMAF